MGVMDLLRGSSVRKSDNPGAAAHISKQVQAVPVVVKTVSAPMPSVRMADGDDPSRMSSTPPDQLLMSGDIEVLDAPQRKQTGQSGSGLEVVSYGSRRNDRTVLENREQIGSLGNCRGEVLGVVTKGYKDKCLVLDMGFNAALILCVPDFHNTPHFAGIKQTLSQRSMTVAHERIVSHELLQVMAEEVQRNTQRNAMSLDAGAGEEARNLMLFNDIVAGAYHIGATDIHFVIRGDGAEKSSVRLRLFGRMSDWKEFPTPHLKAALSAGYSAKSVAGTNSAPDWSPNKPCSTITQHDIDDSSGRRRSVSGRFTSRPTVGDGGKVSIRLLDTDVRDFHIPSLEQLGYAPSHITDQLIPALRKNEGCILIAGGTGSGKSTTLRTFMNDLPDKDRLERYSVEDPVEYRLPGVVQLSIQRASDASADTSRLQFTAALRDLMRMDPDVVMIGEIRDEETSTLTTEMVNTGHRVLATVHGNDCIDVLDRMTGKTLAVPPNSLGSGRYLLACMYQKLLPLLCPHCKLPAGGRLSRSQLAGVRRFGIDPGTLFVANPDGCSHCNIGGIASTGTKGLTVVAEVLTPTREMLQLIRNREWPELRDLWRSSRRAAFGDPDMTGKTALEHAVYKMSQGLLSIDDIECDFEPLETYRIFEIKGL